MRVLFALLTSLATRVRHQTLQVIDLLEVTV